MAREVEDCERMLGALVPGFEPSRVESLEEIAVAVCWLDGADELVRARVEDAAGRFARRRQVDVPRPEVGPLFMREVADVHRELYDEHRELYGEDVAVKIERCLRVTDAEAEAADRSRVAFRETCDELLGDLDLFLAPTIPVVAPPTGIGDGRLRPILISNTLPVNALGWPALALPCGPAEDGLPASVQLIGRPGTDGLVLAVGARLAEELGEG